MEFKNFSEYYNYSIWSLGDGTIIENQNEFTHIYNDTGKYVVQLSIENEFGCVDSTQKTVYINPVFSIYIPTAFTPDEDQLNDYFGPYLRGGGWNRFEIHIFDKWGEKIFEEENIMWDGKINEQYCPNGTYSYTIIAYDFLQKPHKRVGSFLLVR